ncbi:MAG TPA: phosphopentomutase [Planctomycetes bacterium]|nr:phosphopentomutase [Planctomycetota bacterium]HIL36765.1 phosphopentomutase [Planctomycetota bacterium]
MISSRRVFCLVIDSLGVGALPDADSFGDTGTHTLDHLVNAAGGLDAPHLKALGLGAIEGVESVPSVAPATGAFGRMAEVSPGKDTPTGHWEMMGCPLDEAFPLFPNGFDGELLERIAQAAEIPGWIGNHTASGTEVIERYGEEHRTSGRPILYTSGDSVFQIAAHTEHFGLKRLYGVCKVARGILDEINVGRVIARPFEGQLGSYRRTYDRKDWSVPPPRETTLDRLVAAGVEVVGVGKIEDLFNGRGLTRAVHTEGNEHGMQVTLDLARDLRAGLVFVNLVDFDSLYGHRRDPVGYRGALESFDVELGQLLGALRRDDLVFLTADHGNDPTFAKGTDHTREYVPVLMAGPGVQGGVDLGTRASFADLGATIEEAFGLRPAAPGVSFLQEALK